MHCRMICYRTQFDFLVMPTSTKKNVYVRMTAVNVLTKRGKSAIK